MGNSASSQGSSTGTHDGDVGSSISEEQHDWPIEQAVDEPDVQSLQEMRKPYSISISKTNYWDRPVTYAKDKVCVLPLYVTVSWQGGDRVTINAGTYVSTT